MAFLAAFAFFALGYLAQDVVMSSLDCTTQDSWSQETTDLEPWCIFQVIYSDSRAPIFLVRYPYHYLCFLSIGQFHVKKGLMLESTWIFFVFQAWRIRLRPTSLRTPTLPLKVTLETRRLTWLGVGHGFRILTWWHWWHSKRRDDEAKLVGRS